MSKADKEKLDGEREAMKSAAAAEVTMNASNEPLKADSWRSRKKIHPACDVFPLMSPSELHALADDIQANGLRFLVETRRTSGGLYVIDGRNRLDALEWLGVLLIDGKGEWKHGEFIRYGGFRTDAEIATEVASFNLRRHDLTDSQRAVVTTMLASMAHDGDGRGANVLPLEITLPQAAQNIRVTTTRA